jgi:invasion protein IalB
MKLFGMILAASLVAPAVFASETKPTTATKPATTTTTAPATTATKSNTWTLTGVTAANKQSIIDAIAKATGSTKVTLDDKTGSLTVEGAADAAKIVAALPAGVAVKK